MVRIHGTEISKYNLGGPWDGIHPLPKNEAVKSNLRPLNERFIALHIDYTEPLKGLKSNIGPPPILNNLF